MTLHCLGGALTILSSKHPDVAQLAKMASVCRLCGSSVAYSHYRVALFGKKASQERLASRISRRLTEFHVCEVLAEC